MVAPVVGAALVGAGAGLAGGLFGSRSARKQNQANIDAQREFAQHGIQWKVEDAKAAGLHPLYAMGGSGATFSPMAYVDPLGPALAAAGQDVSRAVAATETPTQASAREQALRLAAANERATNEQAALYASQRALNEQQFNARQGVPSAASPTDPIFSAFPAGRLAQPGGGVGQISVKPSEAVSSAPGYPGIEAATGTGMKKFYIPGKFEDGTPKYVYLPAASNIGEALEALSESPLLMFMTMKINEEQFKADGRDFYRSHASLIPFGEDYQAAKPALRKLYDRFTDPDTYRRTPTHSNNIVRRKADIYRAAPNPRYR